MLFLFSKNLGEDILIAKDNYSEAEALHQSIQDMNKN